MAFLVIAMPRGLRYENRPVSSAAQAACVFAADFAKECRLQGDMSNHYRWEMVLKDLRQHEILLRLSNTAQFPP